MQQLRMFGLVTCHLCSNILLPHPIYSELVAKTCTDHGNFFIQEESGGIVTVAFQPYYDKPPTIDKPKRQINNPHPNQRGCVGIPVRCDQTGETFPSLKKAATALSVDHVRISKFLNGLIDHVKGYTFTKLDITNANAPFDLKPRIKYKG